jgi:hypothetical protein
MGFGNLLKWEVGMRKWEKRKVGRLEGGRIKVKGERIKVEGGKERRWEDRKVRRWEKAGLSDEDWGLRVPEVGNGNVWKSEVGPVVVRLSRTMPRQACGSWNQLNLEVGIRFN